MRIAVSGTHRSGKTTLIEELSALLPAYELVPEPYALMVEDGYEFNHPPALEDFEAQLEHSVEALQEDHTHVLFDRCPIDFLAYIAAHADREAFDFDAWLPRVRAAVRTLDLIVFVPVEQPDRVLLTDHDDDGELRSSVDEKLKELLLDDVLDLGVEGCAVEGNPAQRARAVLERVR